VHDPKLCTALQINLFIYISTSKRDNMPNSSPISKAIKDLESTPSLSITAAANKHGCVRSTLSRRKRKITSSRAQSTQASLRLMSDVEERDLISYIISLTFYGLYLAPTMLKGIVERRVGRQIGKNWTRDFIKRRCDELKGGYLNGFDCVRIKGQNINNIRHFFKNISKFNCLANMLYSLLIFKASSSPLLLNIT
jgi:hypothetical protein